jgi:amino-acid N-acetyltransferase
MGIESRVSDISIRRARTPDVPAIHDLIELYAHDRILLAKERVQLYEDVQDFWVADEGGRVVGCGAVHPLWEDIAEIRTVAVDPSARGRGVGRILVERLIATVRELGIARVFVLTFERDFFAAFGFHEIEGTPVTAEVYAELRSSFDEGVAEFLDLERVKPNTLGNHRMLLELS